MERIISSLLSLTMIILALSTILPVILTYSSRRVESGLDECISILSRAIEEDLTISIISRWNGGAVLLVNGSYKIEVYVVEGELICIMEASPT